MYFFTDEEQQRLTRGILPQSRNLDLSDDLRGWNWNRPPLEKVYDQQLALYEVAGKYCPTSRDLFLKRVEGIKSTWNQAMIKGKILHDTLSQLVLKAKKLIYMYGIDKQAMIKENLKEVDYQFLEQWEDELSKDDYLEIKNKINLLWQFESNKFLTRLQELLSKQPYIGVDSLVNLTIPVVTEQKLDGSFLGLSSKLSADALKLYRSIILDFKFAAPRDFHKLTITGYALVLEAIYSVPITVGCLIYPKVKDDRVIIEKDFEIIDDHLRQWFIEERDSKMRIVAEEIDPGVADDCYANCPYYNECH